MPTNLPLARLAAETIDLLVIAPKRGELMRYLGHSRSKAQTKRLPEFFEWALIAQAAPPPRSAS